MIKCNIEEETVVGKEELSSIVSTDPEGNERGACKDAFALSPGERTRRHRNYDRSLATMVTRTRSPPEELCGKFFPGEKKKKKKSPKRPRTSNGRYAECHSPPSPPRVCHALEHPRYRVVVNLVDDCGGRNVTSSSRTKSIPFFTESDHSVENNNTRIHLHASGRDTSI